MAKKKASKVSKTSVKRSNSNGSNKHDDHSFLIIAGGGFVIIAIIMVFLSNRPATTFDTQVKAEVTSEKKMAAGTVSIKDSTFTPETVTVGVGDTVTWSNDDTVEHSVVSDDETFDLGTLAPGESGNYTFTEAGTYSYHSDSDPEMTGTIVVE